MQSTCRGFCQGLGFRAYGVWGLGFWEGSLRVLFRVRLRIRIRDLGVWVSGFTAPGVGAYGLEVGGFLGLGVEGFRVWGCWKRVFRV